MGFAEFQLRVRTIGGAASTSQRARTFFIISDRPISSESARVSLSAFGGIIATPTAPVRQKL
jgi:hypothetical protein